MNVSVMSREQQGDGNQEEQLMGYLKNVVLLKESKGNLSIPVKNQ